jgi:glycosyltransferase involved in cell wall biosynthesis
MHKRYTVTLPRSPSTLEHGEAPPEQRGSVLLLVNRLGIGGAEQHTIALANMLGREFNVVLAYLKPHHDLIESVNKGSLLELRCLNAQRRIDLRAARELLALCQASRARTIVCANAFALMYAQLARWLSPTPIVVIEVYHTTKLRTFKEQLMLAFYRPFFWAAHHLVFVCEAQRRYWRRRALWARQTHTIYNGVDLAHFDPTPYADHAVRARADLGFGADDHVVGICAVLRPEKAHADLLAAVARVKTSGQSWRVLIIGDGPLRESIEREVVRLGLASSVRITGFQSDVRRWLAACDVVALVSTSVETFSIAALEAMAMGKPMIMSDIGGAREQVEDGLNGMIFPPGDVAALAECLRLCWDKSRAQQMGAAARGRVERDFSLKTMTDRYAELLRRVLDPVSQDATAKPFSIK